MAHGPRGGLFSDAQPDRSHDIALLKRNPHDGPFWWYCPINAARGPTGNCPRRRAPQQLRDLHFQPSSSKRVCGAPNQGTIEPTGFRRRSLGRIAIQLHPSFLQPDAGEMGAWITHRITKCADKRSIRGASL